jgi:cytochrome b subunit of formate dehydrogenase
LGAYLEGGHARGMASAAGELPTCVTCHGEHTGKGTRLSATAQCIECHSSRRLAEKYNLPENVGASYADDFHGATMQLAAEDPEGAKLPPVLVCADCHGAHEVGWDESTQIAVVCLECHDRGEPALAGAWLGHARVGPNHQPLIWLVRLFYYFTIPFVLGGLALNILFHLRDQRRRGAKMSDSHGWHRLRARLGGRKLPAVPVVTRFSVTERLEHFGSMTTFILLLLTGLPQTRPELGIARWIIALFGGIGTTRMVHRTVGVLFVALLVVHVTRAILAALRKHRIPAMVPSRQDFLDTLATLRHFLQRTPRPKVGKFDFSEKFEYWGLFLGGTLMSVTGAILIFPEAVTRVLPGELVALFRVMHGLEATFAVLVVVLWHTYGVILRPEIFPLDTSIFTGKMTVERLKEEHALEYERLYPAAAETSDPEAGRTDEGAVA